MTIIPPVGRIAILKLTGLADSKVQWDSFKKLDKILLQPLRSQTYGMCPKGAVWNWKRLFYASCQVCAVFVRAFTLFPFRSFMLLPVCHCFLPVSSPCASLFPPCAFLCLFVYAMCPLVVVRVSTPHLFQIITWFVSLIGFSCVLLFPLV